MSENKKLLFTVGIMLTFAIVFGFMVRHALVSKAAPPATQSDASIVSPSLATQTDSGYDDSPYMTTPAIEGGALQITQLLLSIRNILLMFFGFWFITWCFSRLKVIIRLLYGGKK